jgi:protein gp37
MVSKVIGDFEPRLHGPLLSQFDVYPLPTSAAPWGRNILVCTAGELFGDWVPRLWIEKVFDVVRRHPEYNFLFATRFPARMAEVKPWPRNGWPGTTITSQADVRPAEDAMSRIPAPVRIAMCTPLLEAIRFERPEVFQWVHLGGVECDSKPVSVLPQSWTDAVVAQAHSVGAAVYELRDQVCGPLIQEIPVLDETDIAAEPF